MSSTDPTTEPVVPPEIIDPPPGGDQPVIPEPDPTHTPVIPSPDPDRPAEPRPTSEADRQQETDDMWPVFATGPVTDAMVRGALFWGIAGGLAGLVVGVLVALIPMGDLPYPARAGIVGVIGLLAGSTAGAIYGGGRQPEVEEDVGNQIGDAPLLEKNRDPQRVRRAVTRHRHEQDG